MDEVKALNDLHDLVETWIKMVTEGTCSQEEASNKIMQAVVLYDMRVTYLQRGFIGRQF